MPNPIKYSTSSETLALKKGNFYIGTGDVGKGPSNTTGYYNGVTPSEGGYVIYLNKEGAPGNLSYHNAANDSELISFTNNLAAQSYTSATQCLVYYAGQTDKVVLNRDYENIVTSGLVLNLDAGFTPSYPTSGNTWYDLSLSSNDGTLTNSPTYSSSDGGCIVFDGLDDYISIVSLNSLFEVSNAVFTVNMWVYTSSIYSRMGLWGKNDAYEFGFISSNSIQFWSPGGNITIGINDNNYLNQWKMITSVNSPNGSFIYSNGSLIASSSQLSGSGGSNFALAGGFDPPGINAFNGKISITQIYNRQLTNSEILQNYNAQKGRFGL